jgi:YYY domain-containing protein
VLLAWAIPYFAITGGFYVKFMRYMLPLMPVLYVLGSEMLLQSGAWLRRWVEGARWARIRPLWYALVGMVVVATALWALAFVRIYAHPHTRVAASEWIYDNIPAGATLAIEHWDDALPLGLRADGELRTISEYETVTMALYEPDNDIKFQHITDSLRRADYVVLSSNRLYGSIPRLPHRYPLTTRYYDELFAEELGFHLEKQFTSYPGWSGIDIVDDHADESFTVYDHPKVIIYGKVRDLSDAEYRSALGSDWGVSPESTPAEDREEGKSLMLEGPVENLPAVDDFRWNHWAAENTWMATFTWWLALEAIGLLVLPLCYVIMGPLRDRGYVFAKTMGLLLIAYLTWLPASLSLLPNRLSTVAAGAILLAALSAAAFLWKRRQMVAFWRSQLRWIGSVELIFALSFLAFVGVRILNPDLWQPWLGGEKPMEFAFLNAVLKSPYFPPYDPYFAGGYINYYYYGYFIIAILIKITGISPSVAFNLAIPSLFALTVINSLGMGRMLGRSWGAGLCAAVAVGVLGNLDGGVQFVESFGNLGNLPFSSAIPGLEGLVRMIPGLFRWGMEGFPPIAFDYWRSTRLVPFAINEFPFFSYLFADLHPHMMGLPFTILGLGLIWCVLRRTSELCAGGGVTSWRRRFAWKDLGLAVLLALTLGALATINTWDLPAYLGLFGLVLLIGLPRSGGKWQLLWTIPATVALTAASLLLYWPFFANYQALYVGVGRVEAGTGFEPAVVIWGLFFFLISSYLLNKLICDRARDPASRLLRLMLRRWERLPHLVQLWRALAGGYGNAPRWWLVGLALGGLALVALLAAQQWMMAWVLAMLLLTALLLFRRGLPDEERFLLILLLAGEAILLGCELIYMKDFLDGSEYRRMNTIFKFYIQVWVFWGIGAGALLLRLWSRMVRGWTTLWGAAWAIILAILLGASLIYPIWGTRARVADRFPGTRPPVGTLDGMAFMRVGSFTWPDENNRIELKYDYEAIRWLLDNVPGTPVVAEAALPYYREGGMRVASFTGLPGLLGAHQSEQRYSWMTGERDGKVRQLFDGGDAETALRVLRELRIRYIYVGQLERTVYDAGGLAKFDRWLREGRLEVAFQNEGVTLYRVLSAA